MDTDVSVNSQDVHTQESANISDFNEYEEEGLLRNPPSKALDSEVDDLYFMQIDVDHHICG